MKRFLSYGLALASLTLLTSSCSEKAATKDATTTTPAAPAADAKAVQYTCPMHPEVLTDKPGDCPKCGMALVEKS